MIDLLPLILREGTPQIVNDTVMGGVSSSRVTATDDGHAIFVGTVSLENNGGFASVQFLVGSVDLSKYGRVMLRVRGDGNHYGVNLRSGDLVRLSYRAAFETLAGEWQTITLPLSAFEPTSFGQVVPNAPALDLTDVTMIGFIITGRQAGPFQLEVASIRAE